MAGFDWLFNPTKSNVDPLGFAGPMNKIDKSQNAGGILAGANNLFADQNFIRSLGETGAKISSGVPIGTALGQGVSKYTRDKAVQKAGEQVANKKSHYDKMVEELYNGKALTDPSKNDNWDKMTIGGDKSITATYKHSPAETQALTEQDSLESIKPQANIQPQQQPLQQPQTQPLQLSNEAQADFSGLEPEDVKMILNAKNNAGALTQRAIATYLGNKQKQNALQATKDIAGAKLTQAEKKLSFTQQQKILERKQKIEDKKEDRKFKVDMELLKNKLGKTEPGSIEYRKIEKDMENLDSQIAARDEKTANGGMTPYQVEQNKIAQKRLEMSMVAVEETKKKNVIDQQQDAIKYEEVILDNMNEDAAAPMMDYINQNQNKPYYYTQYVDDGEGLFNLAGDTIGAKLPLITKNGVQMDMESVRASAEKYGMSVDDFLASPGIGILIKGENNDYQPADR